MPALAAKFGLLWETYFPSLFGVAGAATAYAFAPSAFCYMKAAGFSYSNIYSSIFDVAAIFTAFLLAFYTFVVTTERGFIGRAKGTRPYRLLLLYTLRALFLGCALIVLSIPMMVVEPAPLSYRDPAIYAVAIWMGFAVWTASAFIRAAHLFSIFASEHS